MPNTRTAKKRLRQSKKRNIANSATLSRMRTEMKKARIRIEEGKITDARDQFKTAQKFIDKAAKRNLIHANKASRLKSKLARYLASAEKK